MSDHQHSLACLEEIGGQLVCRHEAKLVTISTGAFVPSYCKCGVPVEKPGYKCQLCLDQARAAQREYIGALGSALARSTLPSTPKPPSRPTRPASVPFNLERYESLCPKYARKGKTKEQRAALGYYTFCLREEDRYGGSVFVRPGDSRSKELAAKSKDASDWCKAVGIEHP